MVGQFFKHLLMLVLVLFAPATPAVAWDDAFAMQRQQFLDAEKFLAANHPDEARSILVNLANSEWPLADWAADKLRAMAEDARDGAERANWQRFVVDRFPTSVYRPGAMLDLAETDLDAAPLTSLPLLQTYLRDYPDRDEGRALWLLGEALARADRKQEAAIVFAQAAWWTIGPYAAKADLRLRDMQRAGCAVAPPSSAALWEKVIENFAQKQYVAADAYAQRLATIYPGGPRAFRALMSQVDCALARHRRDEAKSLLQALVKHGGNADEKLAASFRLKRLEKKVDAEKKRNFCEPGTNHAAGSQARFEARRAMLDIDWDDNRFPQAAEWADLLLKDSAGDLIRPDDTLWKAAFGHYLSGEYDIAVARLRRLIDEFPQSRDYDRAQYWLARALHKSGDPTGARQAFRQCYDRWHGTYYGLAAEAWLRSLGEPAEKLSRLPFTNAVAASPEAVTLQPEWEQQHGGGDVLDAGAKKAIDDYVALDRPEFAPAFRAFRELAALGRFSEALQRLHFIKDRIAQTAEGSYFLSVGYSLCGDPLNATVAAQRAFEQVRDGRLLDPHALTCRRRFPLLFKELIFDAAKNNNVDPYLLLSVLKQESGFQESVTSPAGARGLMQIMPATGKLIARQRNLRKFNVAELYKPEVSLDFGAWWLADLLADAGSDLPAALAGYNAGIGRPRRWWATHEGRDYDELIELIPFDETRGSVLGIMRNYEMYLRLYREAAPAPEPPHAIDVVTQKVRCLP